MNYGQRAENVKSILFGKRPLDSWLVNCRVAKRTEQPFGEVGDACLLIASSARLQGIDAKARTVSGKDRDYQCGRRV